MLIGKRIGAASAMRRRGRGFRSDSAVGAIASAAEEKVPYVALYNYPSFSGAYSALFAHLFHSRLRLPCLVLPFSSVAPLRIEDLYVEGLQRCYLLDFVGPKGFAVKLAQRMKVIGFDHLKSVLSSLPCKDVCPDNLALCVDIEKSSSRAAYEYFLAKLGDVVPDHVQAESLLSPAHRDSVETVLKYIEDGDLRRWSLPDVKEFGIGLKEWRSKLNSITNPYMYEQGVRADGNGDFSDEIGKELSIKNTAAGLRYCSFLCRRSQFLRQGRSELLHSDQDGDSTVEGSTRRRSFSGDANFSEIVVMETINSVMLLLIFVKHVLDNPSINGMIMSLLENVA